MNMPSRPASPPFELILASSSPRRQAFFHALGLRFRVHSAELDETPATGEGPIALVARLAAAKAHAVAASLAQLSSASDTPPPLIVAADTTVALGDVILNK